MHLGAYVLFFSSSLHFSLIIPLPVETRLPWQHHRQQHRWAGIILCVNPVVVKSWFKFWTICLLSIWNVSHKTVECHRYRLAESTKWRVGCQAFGKVWLTSSMMKELITVAWVKVSKSSSSHNSVWRLKTLPPFSRSVDCQKNVSLSVCVYLSVCVSLSVCVCLCVSVCVSISLSVYLSACLSVFLLIFLSVCISALFFSSFKKIISDDSQYAAVNFPIIWVRFMVGFSPIFSKMFDEVTIKRDNVFKIRGRIFCWFFLSCTFRFLYQRSVKRHQWELVSNQQVMFYQLLVMSNTLVVMAVFSHCHRSVLGLLHPHRTTTQSELVTFHSVHQMSETEALLLVLVLGVLVLLCWILVTNTRTIQYGGHFVR